jgi:hypothetical protein
LRKIDDGFGSRPLSRPIKHDQLPIDYGLFLPKDQDTPGGVILIVGK